MPLRGLDDGEDDQQHGGGQRDGARGVEAVAAVRGESCGTCRTAAASVPAAIATGRKNVQRQSIWVSAPPITSPSEKPLAPVAV
ncbi:hypothetical protein BL253_35460 [Pseudofrankia asymbiotica]|uniref:Uncharacterized protein n=1 Tax=Pseudofrankia asymbiotica TaxID=1834516 RepID=A0A1V2I041_9ACTN|nr:hypothetical protein BL253_35460 [Pseudofrankia asymbiotica]